MGGQLFRGTEIPPTHSIAYRTGHCAEVRRFCRLSIGRRGQRLPIPLPAKRQAGAGNHSKDVHRGGAPLKKTPENERPQRKNDEL